MTQKYTIGFISEPVQERGEDLTKYLGQRVRVGVKGMGCAGGLCTKVEKGCMILQGPNHSNIPDSSEEITIFLEEISIVNPESIILPY